MEILAIPLRVQDGVLVRTSPERALCDYVNLFFSSRRYGSHPDSGFGIHLEDIGWLSRDEYLHRLMEQFNQCHNGRLSLRKEAGAAGATVVFALRIGKSAYSIQMAMGVEAQTPLESEFHMQEKA
ncbi:hypothetical protein ACFL6M_05050 [Candidatus Eisenbacteria bacterium]|uniref:Uncharacterized protein n=1 Tax=Eiseniibacteriota bacterium TaxID=2212470 RepID=A0ABV6YLA1_UNCEI